MKTRNLLLLALLAMTGGCNLIAYPFVVLFHSADKKVKAEYKGLEEKKTALIVAASPGTEFEYPNARASVAMATTYELGSKVKNIVMVDWEKIDNFQREDMDWLGVSMADVGKKFDAQRVLYVDLIEYSTQEEFSVNLLRGRMTAEVRVYEMDSLTPDEPVYQTEVTMIFPEKAPVPMSDESTRAWVETQSIRNLSVDIARKFYNHTIPNK